MNTRPNAARLQVTTLAKRPDLVPIVAAWLWQQWWRHDGNTLAETEAACRSVRASAGPPQTFVLLADGEPAGTASLLDSDLDERPDLTPWLASVFVAPDLRGRAYVGSLLRAFDDACRSAQISTAWLYTCGAERVYARAGWSVTETIHRHNKPSVTLMRRDLSPARPTDTA